MTGIQDERDEKFSFSLTACSPFPPKYDARVQDKKRLERDEIGTRQSMALTPTPPRQITGVLVVPVRG